MSKSKILRKIAMLVSLIMLIFSTVNTTYGFIVTSTDPIVNIFVPDDVKVSGLTLDKTVEHPYGSDYEIPDNISFDFKIELGSYYANAKLDTTAGEMTADENGSLSVTVKPGFTLGIEGLHEGTVVKVTEQPTTLAGFAIKGGNATREVTVDADGSASIEFVNTYTPSNVQPTKVTVAGTKILEGRDWQEGDTFSFKLEQQTGESWTELATKTITYNTETSDFNTFDFSNVVQALSFDFVGIYTFRMTEIIGELDHMDYDETVNYFAIKVTDTNMDGKLEINTVAGTENVKVTENNGEYTVAVTFNNTFVPPVVPDIEDITVNIEVNKTVKNTGNVTIGPEGFEFVLENVANGKKTTMKSDANGKAIFDMTYTKADISKTFTYRLSETNEGSYGMTYDTDVYDITVSVSLSEANKLVAIATMNGSAVETLVAEFENNYHYDREPLPPTGDDSNVTFWFLMTIVSGATFVSLIIYEKKRGARA